MSTTVHCPTCDKPVSLASDNKFRPFCSARCRLIDLGEWVQEGYAIPDKHTHVADQGEEDPDPSIKH